MESLADSRWYPLVGWGPRWGNFYVYRAQARCCKCQLLCLLQSLHCFFHFHKSWWGCCNCGKWLFSRVPGLERVDWRAIQELFEVLSPLIECLGSGCDRVSLFAEDCVVQDFRFVVKATIEVVHFTCLSRFICSAYFLCSVLQKCAFVLS